VKRWQAFTNGRAVHDATEKTFDDVFAERTGEQIS
jgi:hypothetical protein